MKLCLTEELSDFQKQGMLGNTPQVFRQIVTGYHPPLESKGGVMEILRGSTILHHLALPFTSLPMRL